jgi:methyl halide transferase
MSILLSSCLLMAQSRVSPQSLNFYISGPEILKFAASFGSAGASNETLERISKLCYRKPYFKPSDLTAFEENRHFIYALGSVTETHRNLAKDRPSLRPEPGFRFVRRLIFLKPSTFVVDDQFEAASATGRAQWLLYSSTKPAISGQFVGAFEEDTEIICETLLPENATRQVRYQPRSVESAQGYVLRVASKEVSRAVRFLHVLQVRRRGDERSMPHSELVPSEGQLKLTIETHQHTYRLILPSARLGAGQIAISRKDGKVLVDSRLFPSGILPHGVKGTRLLEQWDVDYRGDHPPLWDAGRPASELIKAVESGTIRPCRVVELGCGSGTDAVYLAGKGFDVTGIDIAPTALRLAQEKALKADVRVRWLLADVLALPSLEPFDFIYDRGCYHELRAGNLPAYLEAVRRLSRSGTRFLLLAGNSNDTMLDYGPPRVTEQEIRDDFSRWFDFEWLRESRFELARPAAIEPLAWSALLRRKSVP